MAILTIRNVLLRGWPSGMAFGTGIALADATYAAVAAGGFAVVASALEEHAAIVRGVGGVLLVGIGLLITRAGSSALEGGSVHQSRASLIGETGKAFLLTLSNPATILVFLALLAGYGGALSDARQNLPLLVAGVFAGSVGWWAIIAATASVFRRRLTAKTIQRVNFLAGAIIVFFGIVAIATVW